LDKVPFHFEDLGTASVGVLVRAGGHRHPVLLSHPHLHDLHPLLLPLHQTPHLQQRHCCGQCSHTHTHTDTDTVLPQSYTHTVLSQSYTHTHTHCFTSVIHTHCFIAVIHIHTHTVLPQSYTHTHTHI